MNTFYTEPYKKSILKSRLIVFSLLLSHDNEYIERNFPSAMIYIASLYRWIIIFFSNKGVWMPGELTENKDKQKNYIKLNNKTKT